MMEDMEEFNQLLQKLVSIDLNKLKSNKQRILDNFDFRLKSATEEQLEKIENCSKQNGPEKIKAFKEFFNWEPLDPAIRQKYMKNNETSTEFSNQGDKAHKQRLYREAVKWYSLALLFSESRKTSAIYEKRSSSLESLGLTEEAVQDLDMDFDCGAATLKKTFGIIQRRETKLKDKLRKYLNQCTDENVPQELTALNEAYNEMFTLKSPNPLAPAVEDSVELRNSPERGRHLVATEDIPLGKTVLVEKPATSVLLNALTWDLDHCHHCYKQKLNCIPCPNCVFTLYCSKECRDSAHESYHKYECPCLPDLHCNLNEKVKTNFHLVFKYMCLLGPEQLVHYYVEQKDQGCKSPFYDISDENLIAGSEKGSGIYESNSFRSIYNLSSNPNPEESENSVLNSLILAYTLDSESAFSDAAAKCGITQEDFRDFLTELILHHYESFKRNAFTICQLEGSSGISYTAFISSRSNPDKVSTYDLVDRADAVYSTASLINHSCNPNLMRVFGNEGGTMALVALRPLKQGQELFISYGPEYASLDEELQSIEARRTFLKETYGFFCNCVACANNWPDTEELVKIPPAFCCPECSAKYSHEEKISQDFRDMVKLPENFKCKSCGTQHDEKLLKSEYEHHCEILKVCRLFIKKSRTVEAIESTKQALAYFERFVCPPNYYSLHLGHIIYRNAVNQSIVYANLNAPA